MKTPCRSASLIARRVRPCVETLEDRDVPSLFATTFRVNTTTDNSQFLGETAASKNGMFVVAWMHQKTTMTGDFGDVYAQLYNADRTPRGTEIHVSTTSDYDESPSVAMDNVGNFVVAFNTLGPKRYDVFAVRFNAEGIQQGARMTVAATSVVERYPKVAMDGTGNFVIAYQRNMDTTNTETDVLAKTYSANGVYGKTLYVAAVPGKKEEQPSVARSKGTDGRFVIGYQYGGDAFIRRYSTVGNSQGNALTLANSSTVTEGTTSVAIDDSGNAIAVWNTQTTSGRFDLAGRKISNTGVLGTPFTIRNTSRTQEYNPTIVMSATDGDFAVAYKLVSFSVGGSQESTAVSEFNSDASLRALHYVTTGVSSVYSPSLSMNGEQYYMLINDAPILSLDPSLRGIFGRWGRLA